ncbi:unnamed protein product [Schistocephalus solidus]|uniref:UDENN domain-containing protein n=1 Tax=Schistocephalus solidus TaxID=70667 RepID=A0A183SHW9_SCHSO|nr:unnamed protein product [Schistocephalus solidus]
MAARKSVLFASPVRTTAMPVWVRDAKEGTVRKTAEVTASPKPVLDLYEVRESILEQIRNKEALPLRRVRGRIGEKIDRVADKSSSKGIAGTNDLIGLRCTDRTHLSDVPRTLSRRSGSGRLNVYERRPSVGDVNTGDIDVCDQTSEATSAFPLPSPPLPPPPPPPPPAEFIEADLKASTALAQPTPTGTTITTASISQGVRSGLYQSAGSFRNTLRIQKTSARGFKEVSFCSTRQLSNGAKSQPPAEALPGCSPGLCGKETKYSSKTAPSYRREKIDIPEKGVPVRLHEDRSAKPMATRKFLDPCSPLRILDSAYPSSSLSSSVAASSSETGHTEDFPVSRTRAYHQREVRRPPSAGASRVLKSNGLGMQGFDLQHDVTQKFNKSPLVYQFHRYGRKTTPEAAAEREPKHLENKGTSVGRGSFPDARRPTVKSVGTECNGSDVEDEWKRRENSGVDGALSSRPASQAYSKFHPASQQTSEMKKTPTTMVSLRFAEVEEGFALGKYTSTLLEKAPRTQDDTEVAAEYTSRQPLIYFSLPRPKRLTLGEKERGTVAKGEPLERIPPRIRYCISSNADRFKDFAPQPSSPMSKEDSGIQTGIEDGDVNACNQQVLSGRSAWRSRSGILSTFHASSVATEAQTTTSDSTFLGAGCSKSTWSFPRHSIYEEQSIRQTEAPAERLIALPSPAGRTTCPPHHYTGLGMFQGLAPKVTRSNSHSSTSFGLFPFLVNWRDEAACNEIHKPLVVHLWINLLTMNLGLTRERVLPRIALRC